ncbi:MAG: Na+ dependent nucleoside transporter N-terminal domain-containing protein [Planctomycetota bacterium]
MVPRGRTGFPSPSRWALPLGVAVLLLLAAVAFGASGEGDEAEGGAGILYRMISFVGIFAMVFLAWVMSTNRKAVSWRPVVWGIALQCLFGLIVLSPAVGHFFFTVVDGGVKKLLSFSEEGASFVMQAVVPHHVVRVPAEKVNINLDEAELRREANKKDVPEDLVDKVAAWNAQRSTPLPPTPFDDEVLAKAGFDPAERLILHNKFYSGDEFGFFFETFRGISPILKTFTFWILPTIIFFSSLMTVLYHLGIMQWVVRGFAFLRRADRGASRGEALRGRHDGERAQRGHGGRLRHGGRRRDGRLHRVPEAHPRHRGAPGHGEHHERSRRPGHRENHDP